MPSGTVVIYYLFRRTGSVTVPLAVIVTDQSPIDDDDGVVVVLCPQVDLLRVGQLVAGHEAGRFPDVRLLRTQEKLDRARIYRKPRRTRFDDVIN